MALAVALAVWTGIWGARYHPTNDAQMIAVIVLEAALLAQTIIALVRLSGTGLGEPVTFIAYSVGILLPLPLGFYLARLERTRWGSIIVCFMALVVAVMTLRLAGLWGFFSG